MKEWYEITLKPIINITATARYRHKKFKKGKTYTVRRKLFRSQLEYQRRNPNMFGFRIISTKKIRGNKKDMRKMSSRKIKEN